MPTILLLSDNSEQVNWGAQATPYAIKRMLQDHIPGVTVRSLMYSWLAGRFRRFRFPLGIDVVYREGRAPFPERFANRLSRPVEFFPEIVDEFEYVADRWMAGRGGPLASEFMTAAEKADVIVHNAENSLYRNTVAGCRALFLLWLAKTRLGKPACSINATAVLASMTRPIMKGMVKLVFPLLDVVTVREPCSLRDLQSLGLTNVELAPDVVFYLNESRSAERAVADWKREVGLNGQTYFCLGASSLPMDSSRPGWDGSVAELVTRLKQLVPQAVLMAKDPHCRFLRDVAQQTGSIYFGPEHSFHELWPLLQGSRFLVSGHMHYIIMGAMVGCPSIPLTTNNHKIQGICELLGWHITEPYDATALRYCSDSLLAEARRLVGEHDDLSTHLLTRSSQLRAEAAKNAMLIKNLLM